MKKGFIQRRKAFTFGFLLLAAAHQAQAAISFINVSDAHIAFTGSSDSFTFADGVGGRDFRITGSDGAGDALGLLGNIGGIFTIEGIAIAGGRESAVVSSTDGRFSIFDGTVTLTSDIAWISIFTDGSTGGLNSGGALNLTNVSYAGSNADLLALAAGSDRTAGITFTFAPAMTLTDLTQNGATNRTAFDGAINEVARSLHVPEGGSALSLLGLALLCVEGLRRRFLPARR